MSQFLKLYAKLVASIGTVLLFVALVSDLRWATRPLALATVFVVTLILRTFQIPLTKYSALNLLGMVAAGGAVIIGAPATGLGLYLGVLLADWLLLRKAPVASAINAGREALALFGRIRLLRLVCGARGPTGRRPHHGRHDPSRRVAAAAHFLFSRGLLYCTLLIRDKLYPDERSLILRYEVIAFGAGTIAVLVSLVTIASVGWTGWMGRGVRPDLRRPAVEAHSRGGRRGRRTEQDSRDGAGRVVGCEPC
jgi:hypothetical protein